MSIAIEDPSGGLTTAPWRPRSLQGRRPPWLRLRWRLLILLAVIALHVLGTRSLLRLLAAGESAVAEDSVLLVDFIQDRPVPVTPPKPTEADDATARPATLRPPPETHQPRPRPRPRMRDDSAMQVQAAPPPGRPARQPATEELQLYDHNGRLRVPDDMLEQIDKQVGDQRVFGYQIPHTDDAKKYFYRNQVLSYESTRFDQYWKPDQDMLTDLLTRLVEKTTKQIKIPIPGHPGSTMVCSITLIALSGGCGVLTNGSDYVGPVDDPDTLDPQEDRQCKAWWDQIIGARTQEVWRKTRSLYEAQCRKPLLRPK